jgi:signal transduction histidine kinase
VVGVINAAFEYQREVSPEELECLLAMGVHLAAAAEAHRLVEDLRRSYSDLSRAQAQQVQTERLAALGEMAAAVAHEVRNPLGVVVNALAAVQRELDAGREVRPLLGIVGEEAERINHLVTDLLDFARPSQPELQTDTGHFATLAGGLQGVLAVAPVPIQLQLDNRLEGVAVALDARLMRQVVVNLAENAVQSMPRGGRLHVVFDRDGSGAEAQARLEFRDSGQGIAPAALPRIFEPFFTTRAQGTGLGLPLVKRILEGHRGTVEVQSELGRGTTFILRWPLEPRA